MSLTPLFQACAALCDTDSDIEREAKTAMLQIADKDISEQNNIGYGQHNLPPEILKVMRRDDADPICALIDRYAFEWRPPSTSDSAAYIEDSIAKSHVELIGPNGFIPSDRLRIGLYGMLPHSAYGVRTHAAEEVYIMLAGEVFWQRDEGGFSVHLPGSRSYHPSFMKHANATAEYGFMSVYIWRGDVSTDSYSYSG